MEKIEKYFLRTILIIWFSIVVIIMISTDYLKQDGIFEILLIYSTTQIIGVKVIKWLLGKYENPTIILFCVGITMLMFAILFSGIGILMKSIYFLELGIFWIKCSIVLLATTVVAHIIVCVKEKIKSNKNRQ